MDQTTYVHGYRSTTGKVLTDLHRKTQNGRDEDEDMPAGHSLLYTLFAGEVVL